MTAAERQAAYRARRRGGPPRPLKPCGTVAAARRHQRAGEPLCDACAAAMADHQRQMYEARTRAEIDQPTTTNRSHPR